MRSNQNRIKEEILSKLKNFNETVVDSFGELAKGKSVFVESNVVSSRMAICNSCDKFQSKSTQCSVCGCFMSAKTRLKKASCPLGKWNSIP